MNETTTIARPSKKILSKITQIFQNEPKNIKQITELMQSAFHKGILDAEALGIIQGAMQVSDMHVREIMIPRSQMVVVKASNQLKDILPSIIESQHSRFPVIGENLDDVMGILLAKDLLPFILQEKVSKINIKELTRPATFVPESKRLNILLKEFRADRNHMAVVVDEYGLTSGLVTIEDVLEQIVGEIEDEHDAEGDHFIKPFKGDRHIVKAITLISSFNDHFNTHFSEEEFDTIGGYITHEFGHLPKRHESLDIGSLCFSVLSSDNRSIRLIQVSPNHWQSQLSKTK